MRIVSGTSRLRTRVEKRLLRKENIAFTHSTLAAKNMRKLTGPVEMHRMPQKDRQVGLAARLGRGDAC